MLSLELCKLETYIYIYIYVCVCCYMQVGESCSHMCVNLLRMCSAISTYYFENCGFEKGASLASSVLVWFRYL